MRYFFIVAFLIFSLSGEELITPVPDAIPHNTIKAALGKKLFMDTILSKNGKVSCNSCHRLDKGGSDNKRFSTGANGKTLRNAPSIYNAVFNYRQFWDARAKDLKELITKSIECKKALNNSFENLIDSLNDSNYKDEFQKIYKTPITKDKIIEVIEEYLKTLITPDSDFDRFLKGDKNALSFDQKKGYLLFKIKGCISCHNGVNAGGNLINRFGIFKEIGGKDLGRYFVTKNEKDRYLFKVPSLRNIELTYPYFHDGRVKDLSKVVSMAKVQLGQRLQSDEVRQIVMFLKSLTSNTLKSRSKKR